MIHHCMDVAHDSLAQLIQFSLHHPSTFLSKVDPSFQTILKYCTFF